MSGAPVPDAAPDAVPDPGRKPARRRRRRLLFVLLALLVGLVLALVSAEVVARSVWQLPPQFAMFEQAGMYAETANGSIGLAPGFRGVFKSGNAPAADVRVSALGMRGPDLSAKQAGERRVLVVGDSLVFGLGVSEDDALPAALSRQLARQLANERSATVGNGGVPGFGTLRSAEHMASLDAAFDADAFVFCSFLGNDALDDLRRDAVVVNGLYFEGFNARLARQSFRFRLAARSRAMLWFETWIANNKPSWSPIAQVTPNLEEMRSMAGLPGVYPTFDAAFAGLFLDAFDEAVVWQQGAAPVIPRIVANLRSALQRAKAIAGQRPLIFVVLPTVWQVDEKLRSEELAKRQFEAAKYPRGQAQRRWLAVAADLEIPAVDVTGALAAMPEPQSLYVDRGGHFNRLGAEIVAREVAAVLLLLLQ